MTTFYDTITDFISDFNQLPDVELKHKEPAFISILNLKDKNITEAQFKSGLAAYLCFLHSMFNVTHVSAEHDGSLAYLKNDYAKFIDHPQYETAVARLMSFEHTSNLKMREVRLCSIVPCKSRKIYIPTTDDSATAFNRFANTFRFDIDENKTAYTNFIASLDSSSYMTWYVNPYEGRPAFHNGINGIASIFFSRFKKYFQEAIEEIIYTIDGEKVNTYNCVNNEIFKNIISSQSFLFTNLSFNWSQHLPTQFKDKIIDMCTHVDSSISPIANYSTVTDLVANVTTANTMIKSLTTSDDQRKELAAKCFSYLAEYYAENKDTMTGTLDSLMDVLADAWSSALERRSKRLSESSVDLTESADADIEVS